MLSSRFPLPSRRKKHGEDCSPPSCRNKKPTDTTEEWIAPSVISKNPDTTEVSLPSCQCPHKYDGEDFSPRRVAHRHNREGFPPLRCINNPQTQRRGFPPRRVKVHINTTGRISPPRRVAHRHNREGFPPLHQ